MSLSALTKKRQMHLKRLVSMQPDINAYQSATVTTAELELSSLGLKELSGKLEELYTETGLLCTDDQDFETQHQPEFDSGFRAIKVLQVKILDLQKAKATSIKSQAAPSFKLERIKLPEFSGSFHAWPSFRDLFSASVDKNSTLSGAEKMIHLKSCLKGESANIVSSFQVTDTAYVEAWDLVKSRYDQPREIIFSHIQRLDEHKPMKSESSAGLRNLADIINETSRSLKVMKVPVDHWDLIFIYLGLKKLDPESRKQWALDEAEDKPALNDFIEFIEERARALASAGSPSASNYGDHKDLNKYKQGSKKQGVHHTSTSKPGYPCIHCGSLHLLYQCPGFTSLTVQQRKAFVDENHLCYNCLAKNHLGSECNTKLSCRQCKKRHNTLLHFESKNRSKPTTTEPRPSTSQETPPQTSNHSSTTISTHHVVLMGTIQATALDANGVQQPCRIFVDNGSEPDFISEGCVNRLGLNRKNSCVTVNGIGGLEATRARGTTNLTICSRTSGFSLNIEALILPKLTGLLPNATVQDSWPHIRGLTLADPTFNRPGQIDILLGAQHAARILRPGLKVGPENTPTAQNSAFGWILSGMAQCAQPPQVTVSSNHVSCQGSNQCLDSLLEKMWALEEPVGSDYPLTTDEQYCEDHFGSTHVRQDDGRYSVQLPFIQPEKLLGNSRTGALQRFLQIEKQLNKKPAVKSAYVNAMRESFSLGFIEPIPNKELVKPESQLYYMPHHMVTKESSSTTKYRIVFNASAKSSNGLSLNDVLMPGPKLQVDLVELLIRFRTHAIALSADITKFYPQVQVSPLHQDFQRIFWREDSTHPLKEYRMSRVTFGVTSAPFLAIRALHQLSKDEEAMFPQVVHLLRDDFLVDNLLSGAEDVNTAIQMQVQLTELLGLGQFQLRQWMSNNPEVLSTIPEDLRDSKGVRNLDYEDTIKTIGLVWQPIPDTFSININATTIQSTSTKRIVLSNLAKVFDPLGWLSPVTIRPKVIMQEAWKAKLEWDEPFPPDLEKSWTSYYNELQLLSSFRVPRRITQSQATYELHGFSDASNKAYAACVYIRSIDTNQQSSTMLVIGKSKVSPVKTETIPRLELCGAVLLTKLMNLVKTSTKLTFSVIRCWTDSTIVLSWLATDKKLPIFVANRVRKIICSYPNEFWHHVVSEENPADCASRGITVRELLSHPLWLHGPTMIHTSKFEISNSVSVSTAIQVSSSPVLTFIKNCSSFFKMKRTIAYCLRFINNLKQQSVKQTEPFTSEDLENALVHIIKLVQLESFKEEISQCDREILPKSMKFLTPFVDDFGILRVGGRLNKSDVPWEQKHPILLPQKHQFTEVLIQHYHHNLLHGGPNLVLSNLRENFWIIRGRDAVRNVIRRCIQCHRHNAKTSSQMMGQLPSSRVTPSRPFSQCGLDYAGPFVLSLRTGRKPPQVKYYVALFVCMATKAIHLETASDLSTAAFTAALTRFISRRGLCADIYCDGGTNFVGASFEMKETIKFLNSTKFNSQIQDFLVNKGINYHFNPPLSPHHGGLWEAGVKSMKTHLKRTIGDRHLTVEEFNTLLCQIESCLNSRPLVAMSHDPNDFSALTPGHFLIGDSLQAAPQRDLTEVKQHLLNRWQHVQLMSQHFWQRWRSEYLISLQSRPKWLHKLPNIEVGILVLLLDGAAKLGPTKWMLGRVTATYPGQDGKIRVCEVLLPSGVRYRRPITRLSPLPIYDQASTSVPIADPGEV